MAMRITTENAWRAHPKLFVVINIVLFRCRSNRFRLVDVLWWNTCDKVWRSKWLPCCLNRHDMLRPLWLRHPRLAQPGQYQGVAGFYWSELNVLEDCTHFATFLQYALNFAKSNYTRTLIINGRLSTKELQDKPCLSALRFRNAPSLGCRSYRLPTLRNAVNMLPPRWLCITRPSFRPMRPKCSN